MDATAAIVIPLEKEWSKSTVSFSHGYQWSNLLVSLPMLWCEEHTCNFSVLQKVHFSNLVFAIFTDTSSCADLNQNNYLLHLKENITVQEVKQCYCLEFITTVLVLQEYLFYLNLYIHIYLIGWFIVIPCELTQLENVKNQIIISGGSTIRPLGAMPHLKY
jgi:hypothetical protein